VDILKKKQAAKGGEKDQCDEFVLVGGKFEN